MIILYLFLCRIITYILNYGFLSLSFLLSKIYYIICYVKTNPQTQNIPYPSYIILPLTTLLMSSYKSLNFKI